MKLVSLGLCVGLGMVAVGCSKKSEERPAPTTDSNPGVATEGRGAPVRGREGRAARPRSPIHPMDADKNGSVSLEEFQSGHLATFPRFDADQTGALEGTEIDDFARTFMSGGGQNAANVALFDRWDEDADEVLTEDEVAASSTVTFEGRDQNGDGKLGTDEMFSGNGPNSFNAINTDGDAFVTLEEWTTAKWKIIEPMDQDGDGTVTRAEAGGGDDIIVDLDGDGAVTEEEAGEAIAAVFAKKDRNQDGMLNGGELGMPQRSRGR